MRRRELNARAPGIAAVHRARKRNDNRGNNRHPWLALFMREDATNSGRCFDWCFGVRRLVAAFLPQRSAAALNSIGIPEMEK